MVVDHLVPPMTRAETYDDLDGAARFWSAALGMPTRQLPDAEGERYVRLLDPRDALHGDAQNLFEIERAGRGLGGRDRAGWSESSGTAAAETDVVGPGATRASGRQGTRVRRSTAWRSSASVMRRWRARAAMRCTSSTPAAAARSSTASMMR